MPGEDIRDEYRQIIHWHEQRIDELQRMLIILMSLLVVAVGLIMWLVITP